MTYPVLYLFPRTDIASMNPGKAMAHTAHGANAFVHTIKQMATNGDAVTKHFGGDLRAVFTAWETATPQGFGTTIVLQAPWSDVLITISSLNSWNTIHTGISTDPTYPYVVSNEIADYIPLDVDTMPRHPGAPGHTVMYRKEDTCAWVFGMKDNPYIKSALGKYPLHP